MKSDTLVISWNYWWMMRSGHLPSTESYCLRDNIPVSFLDNKVALSVIQEGQFFSESEHFSFIQLSLAYPTELSIRMSSSPLKSISIEAPGYSNPF